MLLPPVGMYDNIMKLKLLLLLVLGLCACKQNLLDKESGKAVEEFVKQLKKGSYKEYGLPEFESKHIPELLKYSNDTSIITQFPRNGISSAWFPEVYLGTYILWNIESVRARAINSKFLTPGGFPSLNPHLGKRTPDETWTTLSKEAQKIASDAYHLWWKQGGAFDSDPLATTDYEWR